MTAPTTPAPAQHPTSVRLTQEQEATLDEIAKAEGISRSEVFGRYLDAHRRSQAVRSSVQRASLPAQLAVAPRYKVLADFAGSINVSGVRIPVQLLEGTVLVRELFPAGHCEALYQQGCGLVPVPA